MRLNEQARMPRCFGSRRVCSVCLWVLGAIILTFCSFLPARAEDDAPAQPGVRGQESGDSTNTSMPTGTTHIPLWTSLPSYNSMQANTQDPLIADNLLTTPGASHLYAARKAQLNPVGSVARAIPINLRLGLAFSPRTRFDGGVDLTLPGLSLGPGLSTRIDADAIVSANFGGVTTLFTVTIDQVFALRAPGGAAGIYLGGGLGGYIGETTRFGGKVFAGGMLGSRLGLEGTIHFPGFGDPIWTLQLRLPL